MKLDRTASFSSSFAACCALVGLSAIGGCIIEPSDQCDRHPEDPECSYVTDNYRPQAAKAGGGANSGRGGCAGTGGAAGRGGTGGGTAAGAGGSAVPARGGVTAAGTDGPRRGQRWDDRHAAARPARGDGREPRRPAGAGRPAPRDDWRGDAGRHHRRGWHHRTGRHDRPGWDHGHRRRAGMPGEHGLQAHGVLHLRRLPAFATDDARLPVQQRMRLRRQLP